jgi:hypothetical protein
MWWMLGAVCNAVISAAYLMIVVAIARPLVTNRPLRTTAAVVEHLDREPGPAPLPPEAPEPLNNPAPS